MIKRALIGNAGHAREVMAQIEKDMLCFIDDQYYKGEPGTALLSEFDPLEYEVMIAVGDSTARQSIAKKLPANTKYFSFIHPTALLLTDIAVGEGSFIGAYCILTSNIQIGSHALLNRANHIGHDCIIGNYFSAMPGAIVSGNVHIGNQVFLGTNSTIIEKKYLLHDIKIGANAVVVKDITEPGTYVGTPCKKIK